MESRDLETTAKTTLESLSGKVPESLLQLSYDLTAMFEQQIHWDATIWIGGKAIACHRAVLCARSKWFANRIDERYSYGRNGGLVIKENEQIMHAILLYIYTGNLRLIESLKVPLINLYEAAAQFELDRLKKLLTKAINSEKTTGLTKTVEVQWKIKINDSPSAEYSCLGLKGLSLDGTDKWYMKMKTIFLNEVKHGFEIYIVRKTNSTKNRTHIVSLDLHLMDKAGKRRLSISNYHIFRKDGESKIPEYISLYKLLRNESDLTVTCQLKVLAEDDSNPMVFKINDVHERGLTNELHALSYDMYELLRSERFCDVTIHNKGSASFKAHSYFIYVRSLVPMSHMNSLADVGSFGSIAWKSFIYFLYTGQERYLEDHMLEVYFAACMLELKETRQRYKHILRKRRKRFRYLL